jgi:hypothetical protein
MKAIEIKIARKVIAQREYRIRRMDNIGRMIAYWIGCENSARLARQREFCRRNQQMYMKRYQYYLNHGNE